MGLEKFELRREFESDDAKIAALTHSLLNWDFKLPRDVFHNMAVACRNIDTFRVSHVKGGSASATRDDRHYALDGQDFMSVVAIRTGSVLSSTGDREMELSSGDLFIWQNTGEHYFEVPDGTEQFMLTLPAARFEQKLEAPSRGLQWALRGTTPVGKLVFRFLQSFVEDIDAYDDPSAITAIEMFLGLLSKAMQSDRLLVEATSRTTRFQRILSYIDTNLTESDLSPTAVAEAHRISVRYLNMLFSQKNITVAAWIKDQRLEACLDDLRQPKELKSISEISYKWHFSDASHFSRSFKAKFGTTPAAWRSQNQQSP